MLSLLFLSLVAVAASSPDPLPCDVGDDPWNYVRPLPRNCSGFYLCAHGRAYVFACPAGLRFDAVYLVCDYAYRVRCSRSDAPDSTRFACPEVGGTPTPLSSSAGAEASGFLLLPHPRDEALFFSCWNGVAHLMACPRGTKFDPGSRVCVLAPPNLANEELVSREQTVEIAPSHRTHVTKTRAMLTESSTSQESTTLQVGDSTTLHSPESTTLHSAESTTLHSPESTTLHSAESTTLHSAESTTLHSAESTTFHSAESTRFNSAESTTLHLAESTTSQLKETTTSQSAKSTSSSSELTNSSSAESKTEVAKTTPFTFNVEATSTSQTTTKVAVSSPSVTAVSRTISDDEQGETSTSTSEVDYSSVTSMGDGTTRLHDEEFPGTEPNAGEAGWEWGVPQWLWEAIGEYYDNATETSGLSEDGGGNGEDSLVVFGRPEEGFIPSQNWPEELGIDVNASWVPVGAGDRL